MATETKGYVATTARQVAVIPRNEREEVRIDIDEYKGHPFLKVRVWALLADGRWVATRKGLSVRIHEAEAVADALHAALDLIG